MVGPVDFNKSVEYWQQDKWNGCFPVKWHIVKDVPNSLLKHITLENNENKPVTNSRDTQEVYLTSNTYIYMLVLILFVYLLLNRFYLNLLFRSSWSRGLDWLKYSRSTQARHAFWTTSGFMKPAKRPS